MDLREVWYGGDGGTEAKQARTREGEFCDRVERARKEGKRRKGKSAEPSFLRCGFAHSGRWEKEGSQLRRERREGGRKKMPPNNQSHVFQTPNPIGFFHGDWRMGVGNRRRG